MNESDAKSYLESLGYKVSKPKSKDDRKQYQREYRKKRKDKFDALHLELVKIYKEYKRDDWKLDPKGTDLALAAAKRQGFYNSYDVVSGILFSIADKMYKDSL